MAAQVGGGAPDTGIEAGADTALVEVMGVTPGIRVDVRYATVRNFTGAILPGYEAPRVYLRREAARALGRVQRRLEGEGLGLLVWDGYRPVRASAAMVRWAERHGRLGLLDSGYVARRSRHNLGLAVDLTLVDLRTGRQLPMGTDFDDFSEAAHTARATGVEAANRRRLVEAMVAEGFVNYPREWWHFTIDLPGAQPLDRVIGPGAGPRP